MKVNYGKLAMELVVISILSAIILSLVNYGIAQITLEQGVWYGLLMAVISVVFFGFSMHINPGKEEFLNSIPVVIMALALVELFRTIVNIPALSIEFSWLNLAFGLGSVFLASAITKKYFVKMF